MLAPNTTPRTIADAPLGGYSVAELQAVDDAISAVDMARSARRHGHRHWIWYWHRAGLSIQGCPVEAQGPLVWRLRTPPQEDD